MHYLKQHKLSLGLFGANCSGGLAVTTVPERWVASWENNQILAIMADDAGIDFMLPLGRWKGYGGDTDHNGSSFETLTWAAGILASTKNLLAFGTVHVPLFNPVTASKQITTAHHIGQGRLGLNIVCGWNPDEFNMLGVTLEERENRYAQGQEWLDILRSTWQEEPFNYNGRYYQVKGTKLYPKPYGSHLPSILCAGYSEQGRTCAAKNADIMFTAIRENLDEAPANISALKTLAASYNRQIGVFTNVSIVCRPTQKEAEDYFHYYAIENADKEAVENMVVGRGLDKTGVTEEQRQRFRRHAASGNGALPIVGNPDQVVSIMKRLYGYGISALAMGFANYIDHLPYFKNEVLPRLVSEGLRVD